VDVNICAEEMKAGNDIDKVLDVFFAGVLDAKIINDKAEEDGVRFVLEEAGGVFKLVVAVLGKLGDKFIIGNAADLGQAIHALADLNVDTRVVVGEAGEVVCVKDIFGDEQDWEDLHIFVATHQGGEMKDFYVQLHETCIGHGENAIEDNFG
jgi:hypothetical protein